jgi:CBS domain containing-hemolysin-like protein
LDDPGPLIAALLSGAASFFFSLAESALDNYSGARLLEVAKKRNDDAGIHALIADDDRILLTVRALALAAGVAFCIAVFSLVTAEGGTPSAFGLLRAGLIAFAGFLTVVRMIPLFVGRIFAEEVIYSLRSLLPVLRLVFCWLTVIVLAMRTMTRRLTGRPEGRREDEDIQEEILSALGEGELGGLIGEDEADLIERALDFRDADVADNMQPRTRMFALDIDMELAEAVRLISESGHSRIPLYRKNMDEIVGILYVKDLLKYWGREEAGSLTLDSLKREPFFVPESKPIIQMLDEFKRRKMHLAIVLDEYGGTAGMITIEDILEEIVGEIEDEYDEAEDTPLLQMFGEREAEVDAQVHVDDLADALDVEIESDEYDTVGGLVFSVLGRIPAIGDEFDHAGLHITVLDANERSVNRVRVVRAGDQSGSATR